MKPLITTKNYIDQCLCVQWLWGQVFIKVMTIFKIELHHQLLLIRYESTKATIGGEIMKMVFSGILRHILCLGMNM